MSPRRSRNRYSLLLLRRLWDRIWAPTFVLGILLSITWWQASSGNLPFIQSANNLWILFGAVISLFIGIFALLARNMNYIQPFESYVRIVTPFLRMNVSYRRIRSIRPADMVQLFPPKKPELGSSASSDAILRQNCPVNRIKRIAFIQISAAIIPASTVLSSKIDRICNSCSRLDETQH